MNSGVRTFAPAFGRSSVAAAPKEGTAPRAQFATQSLHEASKATFIPELKTNKTTWRLTSCAQTAKL
jgi:hypothetical protein